MAPRLAFGKQAAEERARRREVKAAIERQRLRQRGHLVRHPFRRVGKLDPVRALSKHACLPVKAHTTSGARPSGIRIVHRDRDAEGVGDSQRLGEAHRRLASLELPQEAATDPGREREILEPQAVRSSRALSAAPSSPGVVTDTDKAMIPTGNITAFRERRALNVPVRELRQQRGR